MKTFPSTLKNEGKGRIKRGNGKKNMRREGKRIFSNVPWKIEREEKEGEGETKNEERATFFRLKYFKLLF